MPNIRYLYLQTNIRIEFIYFIENIIKRLKYLNCFNCFIKELLKKNDRISNLNDIHQINSCFKSIQLIKDNEHYTIFATE